MRLRIVSKEDVDRLLEEQQRAIREEADRILAMQKQAKTPVDDARRTLSKTDKLPEPLRDQVKNAEIIQRQVNNRVTNKADGLEQKIRQFQQDARDFKANNPDTDRQMAAMREAVERIKDRNLNPAEQALSQATKGLEQPQPNGAEAPQPDAQEMDQAKDQAGSPRTSGPRSKAGGQPQGQQAKGEQAQNQAGEPAQGQGGDQAEANRPKGRSGAQPKSSKGASPKGQAGRVRANPQDRAIEGSRRPRTRAGP